MSEDRVEYIMTKEDGIQPFYWKEKEHFKGRVTEVYSGNTFDSMVLDKSIPIPDDSILCDFCNTSITEFPVPVFRNSYALCPACFKRTIV